MNGSGLLSPVAQYVQGIANGWLRNITVSDAIAGLTITQSGAGLSLWAIKTTATNNAVVEVGRISYRSTGAGADGIGAALTLWSKDAAGNLEEAGRIAASFPTAAHATQTGRVRITALGAADGLNIWNSGLIAQGSGSPIHAPTGLHILGISEFTGDAWFTGNVGIGVSGATVVSRLHVAEAYTTILTLVDLRALAADIGARIDLQGVYTAAGAATTGAYIKVGKVNATDNNFSFYLAFATRLSGSAVAERVRIDENGNMGLGATLPASQLELERTVTITGATTDGHSATVTLDPAYTAAAAQTVTCHNYMVIENVDGGANVTVTDAAIFRFNAAAGTHKAVDGASTKATPTAVDAWAKININGTIYYMPAYTSKTA